MRTFKDLKFKQDPSIPNKQHASMGIGDYTISVVFGDGCYGSGPAHDTYEVALFQTGHEDPVPLQSDENSPMLGWCNHEEITALMRIVQREPGFGDACRVFQRTHYNRRFSNISQLRDQAFS